MIVISGDQTVLTNHGDGPMLFCPADDVPKKMLTLCGSKLEENEASDGGKRDCYRIETGDGRVLELGTGCAVKTHRGIVLCENLMIGDYLIADRPWNAALKLHRTPYGMTYDGLMVDGIQFTGNKHTIKFRNPITIDGVIVG